MVLSQHLGNIFGSFFMKNVFKPKLQFDIYVVVLLSNSVYLLPYCKKNTACLTFHRKTPRLNELKKVLSEIHWPIILLSMGFNNHVESIVQCTRGGPFRWNLKCTSKAGWEPPLSIQFLISFFLGHQIHSFKLIKLEIQLKCVFLSGHTFFEWNSIFWITISFQK